ncbi:tetratricopeptide repeat protein [bacterium]|nr:tetratricopeptide repeat protein [bacterium]
MGKENNRVNAVSGGGMASFLHKALVLLMPALCFLTAVIFYLKTYDSATIKITFVQVGGSLLIGMFLLKKLEDGLFFSRETIVFLIPVTAYFLWGCFSYALSPFKMWASFDELWRRCIYTGFVFIGFFEFRKLKDARFLTSVLMLTCFVVCFYGVMQRLGFDPYAWKGAFGGRNFSTFGNPNFFGAWLVGVAAFPLAKFFKTRSPLYAFLYLLAAYGVWISVTKGSFIGFFATTASTLILTALFAGFLDRKKVLKFLRFGLPLFFAALIVLVVRAGNPVSYKFRIFTWMSGLEMLKKHPVAGTSIGSFKEVYPMFRHPEIFHIEGKHNTETDHFHCEFLEIFYDEGLIGFGLYLLILFITFYSAAGKLSKLERVSAKSERKELVDRTFLLIGWMSGALGMFVQAQVDVHMRFVSSGHLFWLMIGVIGALTFPEKEKKEYGIRLGDLSKIILQFAVIAVTIYSMLFFRKFFIADVNHNIAIAYSKQGAWERALYHYDRVVTLWPRFIMAHYFTGNVYNDRWDPAPRYHPLWDKKFPKDVPRTDPQRTIAKYDDVLSMAPIYVQVHYQEGNIYLKMNQYERAVEKFNQAIDIDPVFPLSSFRKGYCLVQLGRYADAEQAFEDAIVKQKIKKIEFVEAYLNLANVLYLEKKYDEAEVNYKKVVEITGSKEAYISLLNFYKALNRNSLAKKTCLKILEIDPNDKKAAEILKGL